MVEFGWDVAQIHRQLVKIYGSGAWVSKTIKRYTATGDVQDRPRSGKPRSAKTKANVQKV